MFLQGVRPDATALMWPHSVAEGLPGGQLPKRSLRTDWAVTVGGFLEICRLSQAAAADWATFRAGHIPPTGHLHFVLGKWPPSKDSPAQSFAGGPVGLSWQRVGGSILRQELECTW